MITLITGVPGVGKTALCVDMMAREANGRVVYVDGIPELAIPHEPAPPVREWTHLEDDASSQDGKKLSFTFPPGALVVIDEAQRIYRPRSVGKEVPPHVAAFETHRHTGIDFWLLTQHPGLLDANIRKLVTRHIHLRQTALGRKLYEWQEVGDPESKGSRDIAARRSFKLPAAVFSKYKSATLHTKTKKRVPLYMWVCGIACLSFVVTLGIVYRNISAKMQPAAATAAATKAGTGAAPQATTGAPSTVNANNPQGWFDAQVARVDGLPHTAPAYDALTAPKVAPFPAGCVASPTACQCYTVQATPVVVPAALCRSIVADGLFDPSREVRVAEVTPSLLGVAVPGRAQPNAPASSPPTLDPAPVAVLPHDFKGTHIAPRPNVPSTAPAPSPAKQAGPGMSR